MPVKRPELINGGIYHIFSRGVEKRNIFLDEQDYFRFIHDLYEFNDDDNVSWIYTKGINNILGSDPRILKEHKVRKLLVKILAFCLMPNHFHLVLEQSKDKGVSRFIKKLSGGYAVYFNQKYKRTGHLFQGRFRVVHIKDEEQLKNAYVYVHTNPISLIEKSWKEEGINDSKNVIEFLNNKYRFSSYFDYIGNKNFPSVTNRELISNIMGSYENCRNFIDEWILYKHKVKELSSIIIE